MQINENGHRFANYYKWEDLKNQPYNYAQKGIVKYLLSSRIVESKNKFLKFVLSFYEYCIIYMMKSVDYIKHFKNFNWKNR